MLLDALSRNAIAGSAPEPPAGVADGECYRVTASLAGPWSGYTDHIAIAVGGSWHLVAPAEGMIVFDREAGHWLCYRNGWNSATAPATPADGVVVDQEARAALGQLVAGLQALGLLASGTT